MSGALSMTPPGKYGRKRRLRPADDLHRRAVQQQLGSGGAPDHLVDDVVRAVGGVGDAVAVKVERRVVAPVIAAARTDQSRERVPTYITWFWLATKEFPVISFRSEPAVKWMPITQPSNQLPRNVFLLAL